MERSLHGRRHGKLIEESGCNQSKMGNNILILKVRNSGELGEIEKAEKIYLHYLRYVARSTGMRRAGIGHRNTRNKL